MEDDGMPSESGSESEGEEFEDQEEEEEEDEDEDELEEEDDEEDYDFGSTRRTRARARRQPAARRSRATGQPARAAGARASTRRRAAASTDFAGDSDYSDEEVQPTRRSARPRKRARVTMDSDEESEDEGGSSAAAAAGGDDGEYEDEDAEEEFNEEGWYETQEDDTIQSISAWHGLDEDEMLDMNRRRIRGISQCAPSIAKKMKLKKGTWLELSEVVGPGWGDGGDEDVPVVDHQSRRRQRANGNSRGSGGGASAAASPRTKKKKGNKAKDAKGKKKKKKNGRRSSEGGGSATKRSSSQAPAESVVPRNAYYWLNEHFSFLFRYIPQIGDEVTYVQALHREYDATSRVRLMTPPYESIRNLRSAEHCKVVSLEYFVATPPTINRSYVKMKLERLWEEGEKASRTVPSFDLYYFPVLGSPDFLVLSAWYKEMVKEAWAPGQRVVVPFMEELGEDEDWAVTCDNYAGEVIEVAEVARPSKFFATTSNTSNSEWP